MMKEGRCNVDDAEIHYVEAGRGFPVLLVHGLAGDHAAWERQLRELSTRYRVIAPDNRGAGRSSGCNGPIQVRDLGSDFVMLLERLGVERCHVVGRSLGGMIGQEMALQRPELVHSLIMLASAAKFDSYGLRCVENMLQALEWRKSWADYANHSIQYFLAEKFYNTHPSEVESLLAFLSKERDFSSYRETNIAVRKHDVLDHLKNIKCPALVVAGGRDPLCTPTATSWMSQRIPQCRTEIFHESSHFFFMEEAERFNKLLGEWLEENTPPGDF